MKWRFRLVILVIIGLGAWLHRDALRAPLVADDLAQRAMIDGEFPSHRSVLDLYDFADGSAADHQRLLDAGALPWWAAPGVRFAFARPFASALIAVDHALFGHGAVGPHVHSFLWYAAMLASIAALVRTLFGARIAAIATLLFAMDESLIWGLSWAANRHAVLSVTFSALALRGYVRARRNPEARRRDLAMVSLWFALSLAAGELGACMLAYAGFYEVFVSRDALLKRARASWPWLLPFCALAIGYVVFHRGAAGSDVYVDPLAQPREYARIAPARYVAMLADVLFARPFDATPPDPVLLGKLALAFGAAVAMAWHAARRLHEAARRHLLWLAAGALTAMAPTFGSIVTERLALPSELGVSVIAAVIVSDGVAAIPGRWRSTGEAASRAMRLALAALVLVVHVGIAGSRTLAGSRAWTGYSSAVERSVAASETARGIGGDSTFILLSAIEPTTTLYVPLMWHVHGTPLPRASRVLAYGPSALVVARVAPHILDVFMEDDVWMSNTGETLYRTRFRPFRAGDVVTMRGMRVTILTMGRVGPRMVRFQFDRTLDDPSMVLCVSTAGGIVRVPPPLLGFVGAVPPPEFPVFVPQERR